jgi:hypothetical protein
MVLSLRISSHDAMGVIVGEDAVSTELAEERASVANETKRTPPVFTNVRRVISGAFVN